MTNANDPLSPPARRIADAFWRACLGKEQTFANDQKALAAALRVALDEVLPAFRPSHPMVIDEKHRKVDVASVRYLLLDIANELEGRSNG